ncbi:hypothetical protein WJX72_011002 [[Myrmecia] bisecta]|uniref:Uncharacterized protein n=1 Tax=[Myrmecia] bisecta TaxID=41462 RepID=A0AAW1P3A8_9CHLO
MAQSTVLRAHDAKQKLDPWAFDPLIQITRLAQQQQQRFQAAQQRWELKRKREKLQAELSQLDAQLFPGQRRQQFRRNPPPGVWGIATMAAGAATLASSFATAAACSACAASLSATAFCAAATGTLAAVQVGGLVLGCMEQSFVHTGKALGHHMSAAGKAVEGGRAQAWGSLCGAAIMLQPWRPRPTALLPSSHGAVVERSSEGQARSPQAHGGSSDRRPITQLRKVGQPLP